MNIQRVTTSHISQVAPLFDAYRQFYKQSSNVKDAHQFLEERVQNDQSIIFMATQEGEPAGFVQLYPTFSSISLKRAYILNDLFVHEAFRKHGVGRALIEEAYAFSVSQDAAHIRLQTAQDNHNAQRLYKEMGMEVDEMLHFTKNWV